jgi:hypothetical protein
MALAGSCRQLESTVCYRAFANSHYTIIYKTEETR